MRALVVFAPFVALALLEVCFRLFGAYAADPWTNPYVSFERDAIPFPAWDKAVPVPKPRQTIRIVALGGSSTFGLGVDEPFAKLVERRLRGQWPNRTVEVINGGVPAIGSHRVFEVLKRASQFEVDAAIVYMGHNEFLEEIFFDPNSVSARAEYFGSVARQIRVVNWLRSLAEGLGMNFQPKVQRHFIANRKFPLIHSEEQYQARLKFLEANIRQMIRFAKSHHIQIVFMPAVPSLLTPPGDSVHGPEYAKHADAWERLHAQLDRTSGTRSARPSDSFNDDVKPASEAAALEKLCELDDKYAMSHYLLGLKYLELGDAARALQELRKANLLDLRGDRSNDDIIEVIERVCIEEGVAVIDVRDRFYARLAADYDRIRRQEKMALFLDHCHPSQEAHQLLADEFVKSLVDLGK